MSQPNHRIGLTPLATKRKLGAQACTRVQTCQPSKVLRCVYAAGAVEGSLAHRRRNRRSPPPKDHSAKGAKPFFFRTINQTFGDVLGLENASKNRPEIKQAQWPLKGASGRAARSPPPPRQSSNWRRRGGSGFGKRHGAFHHQLHHWQSLVGRRRARGTISEVVRGGAQLQTQACDEIKPFLARWNRFEVLINALRLSD